jgi:archaellum component FlaC
MNGDLTNMSTPVTRGELRDELAQLEDRIERKFDDKLGHLERKFDNKLDLWGGALLARITESENRMVNELKRHAQALFEAMTKQISVIDEKYNDLPARVSRLEAAVFEPERR